MIDTLTRPLMLGQPGGLKLIYGENKWQTADLFTQFSDDPLELGKFILEEGELPSATNITDLDRGIKTLTHIAAALEVNAVPNRDIAIALKHGNCCGAAYAQSTEVALRKMIDGDKKAIMGGVVLCNFAVTAHEAEQLLLYACGSARRLLDVIVAASFTEQAREMLARKAGKCRLISNSTLLELGTRHLNAANGKRTVRKGYLTQDADNRVLDLKNPDMKVYGPENEWCQDDLAFASALCRTSNSNTITLVHKGMLIGQGVGQTRRDRAAKFAVSIAFENKHWLDEKHKRKLPEHTVACSDSFFPLADGVKALIKPGVGAIFSTSGAMRDKEVQSACVDAGVTLYQLPDKDARMFFGH